MKKHDFENNCCHLESAILNFEILTAEL